MVHKVKTLGLAVVAVLAMSAMIAQAAQAAPFFHSEASSTTLEGTQIGEQKFVTSGGTVKCTTATFTGSQSGTTVTTVTLKPVYSGCTAFGFAGASVDTSGTGHECGYLFHMVENSSPPTATADVECNAAGEDITVTVPGLGCTVHIPQQTGLKHIVFSNTETGSKRDIDANVTIEGIKYNETSGCFFPGERTNGTLTGSATIKGFSGGVQVGIWAE